MITLRGYSVGTRWVLGGVLGGYSQGYAVGTLRGTRWGTHCARPFAGLEDAETLAAFFALFSESIQLYHLNKMSGYSGVLRGTQGYSEYGGLGSTRVDPAVSLQQDVRVRHCKGHPEYGVLAEYSRWATLRGGRVVHVRAFVCV